MTLQLLEDLAVGGIHDADRVVFTRDGDLGSIAAHCHRRHGRRQPFDLPKLLAIGDRIKAHRLVCQCDGQPRPILLNCNRGNRLAGRDLLDELAVGRVPDADRLVISGGGQFRAIAARCKRCERSLAIDFPRPSHRELPESSHPIRPGRDELLVAGQIRQPERTLGGRLDHAVGCEITLPETDGVCLIGGGELCSVTAPGCGLHLAGVAFEVLDGLAGRQVPDLDRLARGGGELLAIGLDGQRLQSGGMAAKGLGRAGGRHVPDLGGIILAARQNFLAIGRECDGQRELRVSLELLDLLARDRIPQADGVVETRGGDHLAIRTPGHRVDRIGVPIESPHESGLLRHRDSGRRHGHQHGGGAARISFQVKTHGVILPDADARPASRQNNAAPTLHPRNAVPPAAEPRFPTGLSIRAPADVLQLLNIVRALVRRNPCAGVAMAHGSRGGLFGFEFAPICTVIEKLAKKHGENVQESGASRRQMALFPGLSSAISPRPRRSR